MLEQQRLKIAIQKKGRLNQESIDLLSRCGLKLRYSKNTLLSHAENLPIDVLFVRDDDIPTLVMDGVCDIGIVGENVLLEKAIYQKNNGNPDAFELVKKLGFSRCRLSIAFPQGKPYLGTPSLHGLRIATSYPHLLQLYLNDNQINAEVITISGSVEIAPRLGMADAICDLVSSGQTLEENNLCEVAKVIDSQAVLIKSNNSLVEEMATLYELLLSRMCGVLQAQESKYIMFHAPKTALSDIKHLLPGFETPTVLPLENSEDTVAVHLVSKEGVFWNTLEKLKQMGASSILVLPIEKMMT